MTTTDENVRVLAEMPCPAQHHDPGPTLIPCKCGGDGYNSKTAALRKKHDWEEIVWNDGDVTNRCKVCRVQQIESSPAAEQWARDNPEEIARWRASLGEHYVPYYPYCLPTGDRLAHALDTVTAACGWTVTKYPDGQVSLESDGMYWPSGGDVDANHAAALVEAL